MSTNPNTIKSQDDLIKRAFENQNDDLIKNALNSGYIKSQDCKNCKLSDEECSFGCVKSQDDLPTCNEGKRKSDVLLEAIDEMEILKTENKWYSEQLHEASEKCERLQKQFDRAIWWLNEIVTNHRFTPISTAEKALKELNNEK